MSDEEQNIEEQNIEESKDEAAEAAVKDASRFASLNGRLLHIKVGDEEMQKRFSYDQLTSHVKDIEDRVEKLVSENEVDCLVLVTPYYVDVELI